MGNSMSPGSAIDAGGHEKVGQGTGHEQAMSVLVDPAVARLGKAEHPLDDPDRMLDPGPHFGLGTIFRRLDLVHNTAVAVAKVNEVLGLGGVLPDHGSLAAVSLIAPHAGLVAMQQIGQHSAVGDIGWRRHSRTNLIHAAVDAKMRLQNVAKPRQNPTPSPLLPMRGP